MKKLEQIVWLALAAMFAVIAIFDPDACSSMMHAAMTGISLILAKLCGLERR